MTTKEKVSIIGLTEAKRILEDMKAAGVEQIRLPVKTRKTELFGFTNNLLNLQHITFTYEELNDYFTQ